MTSSGTKVTPGAIYRQAAVSRRKQPRTPYNIERAKGLYRYIVNYFDTNGIAPTVREIKAELGYGSMVTPLMLLRILREDGLIEFEDHRRRSIRLTKDNPFRRVERLRRYALALEHYLRLPERSPERADALRVVTAAQRDLQPGDL